MSQHDDSVRLQHMVDAAKEAVDFLKDQSREVLQHHRMLLLSLVRCIEVIGEAASKITKEFQQKYPEIPWPLIVAMRNRMIHAYYDVDSDRVWEIVKSDLPPLIIQLEKILSARG